MDLSRPFFPEHYEESRGWFRNQLEWVRRKYPQAVLHSRALEQHSELTTDWITAPSQAQQCLIISTALHGVEGFTGTAVLDCFLRDFLPRLDPGSTGLLLIHAINPWGMQHRRRTNNSNIDLNRNFRFDGGEEPVIDNPGYAAMRTLLHPQRKLGGFWAESLRCYLSVVARVIRFGIPVLRDATLRGQSQDPSGIYFGGTALQQESRLALDLGSNAILENRRVIHLDVHTGYGPASRLTMVNSPLEQDAPARWRGRFDFPDIVCADPRAFYSIVGDWTDALYRFSQKNTPDHQYFGTTLEFGTVGDGLLGQIRALRAVIFENQKFHYGAASSLTRARVEMEYRDLFDPPSANYRRSVKHASQQAFTGVLNWFGLLSGVGGQQRE